MPPPIRHIPRARPTGSVRIFFPVHLMKKQPKTSDAYIIDTYRSANAFLPGVILFCGRRRMETIQWKEKTFPTAHDANRFVRDYCIARGLREAANEEELARANRK